MFGEVPWQGIIILFSELLKFSKVVSFPKQNSWKENRELLEYWGILFFEMESSKLNNHSETQWLNVSRS
jgi:hypothetical protein